MENGAKIGRCLNQQTVEGYGPNGIDSHQLLYSYNNKTDSQIYFGIQIYNPNSRDITFEASNFAHHVQGEDGAGGWYDVATKNWLDFFAGGKPIKERTVRSNEVYWIEKSIPTAVVTGGDRVFSGLMRIKVSRSAIVTVYVYKDKSQLKGAATRYVKHTTEGKQFSGIQDGFFLFAPRMAVAKSDASENGKFISLTSPDYRNQVNGVSKSDLIPIHDVYERNNDKQYITTKGTNDNISN